MTPFSMHRRTTNPRMSLRDAGRCANGYKDPNQKLARINFKTVNADKVLSLVFSRVTDPNDRMACLLVNKNWRFVSPLLIL
jgi:hypothetical protein